MKRVKSATTSSRQLLRTESCCQVGTHPRSHCYRLRAVHVRRQGGRTCMCACPGGRLPAPVLDVAVLMSLHACPAEGTLAHNGDTVLPPTPETGSSARGEPTASPSSRCAA